MQYDELDMLTGVIGGVVRGSRVYLVHLACMCSIGIWHGSVWPGRSCGVCRGSSLLRDMYRKCIVFMYLHGGSVKSLCRLENPLGCCRRINID